MKAKNIFGYLKMHYKAYFRSKSAIFFSLFFPILLMLLFGSIFSGNGQYHSQLLIQNQSPSVISWKFVSYLNQSNLFSITLIGSNVNISNYIYSHSITSALLIPSNFTQNALNQTKTYLIYYEDPGDTNSIQNYQILSNIVVSINMQIYHIKPAVGIINEPAIKRSPNMVDYYVPGLIGFTILNPMFSMIYTVPNYRKEKIFRQLSLTGLKKSEWIVANIIHSFFITILGDILLLLVAYDVFGVRLNMSGSSIVLFLIIIVLGIFSFLSLGIIAGMASENEETVSIIGNIILFPMMFLSGVFIPLTTAPQFLKTISEFLPLTYFINAMTDIFIFNNVSMAIMDILVIICFTIVFFAIALYVFFWNKEVK
ncbi:MAG: ABC transporter permease [Thermoplasmata archaeon]